MKTGHLGQEALGVSFNTGRDTHPDTWTHHVGGLTSRLLDSTEGPPPGRWSASEEEVGHVASANALGRSLPGFHTLRKQNLVREPGGEQESLPRWVTLGMSSCNPISALLLPWQPQELLVEAILFLKERERASIYRV